MKIVVNQILPFTGSKALNLFGILFVKSTKRITKQLLNHESIHSVQFKEVTIVALIVISIAVILGLSPYFLFLIPFTYYIMYGIEYLVRLLSNKDAYRSIYFEQEAYKYEKDLSYLENRKHFAMWSL